MFPWLMPNVSLGGQMSLLQMMYGSPQGGLFSAAAARRSPAFDDDRSDQTRRGNQPDTGNSMAPPGQQPPGGPDDPRSQPGPTSGYDYNTVSPGWGAPAWMQMLGRGQQQRDPRAGMQMGLLGLSMLQPRQPNAPRPYPWI